MDTNNALAELRAAFPRVGWTAEPFAGASIMVVGRHAHHPSVVVLGGDDEWRCDGAPGADPVSAVRAWLAAQPTAAFYPEAQGGETVEVRGCVAVDKDGAYAAYGSSIVGDNARGIALFHLSKVSLAAAGDVAVRAFTLRVPLPVDPPVLVGEVSDV